MWRKFCWPFLSTRLRPLVEKVLLTLPEHSTSAQDVSRICVAQSVCSALYVISFDPFVILLLVFCYICSSIYGYWYLQTGFDLFYNATVFSPICLSVFSLGVHLLILSCFYWFHETIASIVDVTVSITRTHQQQLTCQRSSHHCNKHKISDETFSPDSVLLRYILTTLYNTTSKIVPDDSYLTKLLYSTHAVNTVMK